MDWNFCKLHWPLKVFAYHTWVFQSRYTWIAHLIDESSSLWFFVKRMIIHTSILNMQSQISDWVALKPARYGSKSTKLVSFVASPSLSLRILQKLQLWFSESFNGKRAHQNYVKENLRGDMYNLSNLIWFNIQNVGREYGKITIYDTIECKVDCICKYFLEDGAKLCQLGVNVVIDRRYFPQMYTRIVILYGISSEWSLGVM